MAQFSILRSQFLLLTACGAGIAASGAIQERNVDVLELLAARSAADPARGAADLAYIR
ncbi:hypothetical protein A2U01_0119579, partial [Trifolium medium]|nr:hypothetical protein [Trifolium medium]